MNQKSTVHNETQFTSAVDLKKVPVDRILLRADLCKALSISPETLRRWIKAGTVPTPDINLSLKTQAWRLSSLNAAGIGIL